MYFRIMLSKQDSLKKIITEILRFLYDRATLLLHSYLMWKAC